MFQIPSSLSVANSFTRSWMRKKKRLTNPRYTLKTQKKLQSFANSLLILEAASSFTCGSSLATFTFSQPQWHVIVDPFEVPWHLAITSCRGKHQPHVKMCLQVDCLWFFWSCSDPFTPPCKQHWIRDIGSNENKFAFNSVRLKVRRSPSETLDYNAVRNHHWTTLNPTAFFWSMSCV